MWNTIFFTRHLVFQRAHSLLILLNQCLIKYIQTLFSWEWVAWTEKFYSMSFIYFHWQNDFLVSPFVQSRISKIQVHLINFQAWFPPKLDGSSEKNFYFSFHLIIFFFRVLLWYLVLIIPSMLEHPVYCRYFRILNSFVSKRSTDDQYWQYILVVFTCWEPWNIKSIYCDHLNVLLTSIVGLHRYI